MVLGGRHAQHHTAVDALCPVSAARTFGLYSPSPFGLRLHHYLKHSLVFICTAG